MKSAHFIVVLLHVVHLTIYFISEYCLGYSLALTIHISNISKPCTFKSFKPEFNILLLVEMSLLYAAKSFLLITTRFEVCKVEIE